MPNAAKVFDPFGRKGKRPRDHRPSAAQRGYDSAWIRCSRLFLARPANRWCFYCSARGIKTLATCVDHVKPLEGPRDPLRLSWSNLRPSCVSCNTRKGYQDRKALR